MEVLFVSGITDYTNKGQYLSIFLGPFKEFFSLLAQELKEMKGKTINSQMKDNLLQRVIKKCVLIHSPDSFVEPNVHCLMSVARESQLLQINY